MSKTWPEGFRINPHATGPSPDWLARFRDIPTSWIGDAMGRNVGTMGLNRYHGDIGRIACGPALTVRVRPGDNLMLHKAMELAEPGHIIVVDGGGDTTQALIGGNMMTTALLKQIGGFVIDGAIRDLVDWAEADMPIWARAHTHRGPFKDGPGEINVPVSVGGMAVMPGDMIVGDADSVVAIPVADLDTLWPRIEAQKAKEAKLRGANANVLPDPERFNAILRAKGCPV